MTSWLKALSLVVSVPVFVACAAGGGEDPDTTPSSDEALTSSSSSSAGARPLAWGAHNEETLAKGATDRFTFKARKGWVVSLVVQTLDCAPGSSNGFGCKPLWAPKLVVINASTRETVLEKSGNLTTGDALGETKKLPADGSYVVLVSSATDKVGKYDLTLSPPEISCTRDSECPSEFPRCELIGEPDEDGDAKECN
jgi:hypothetical protein